MPQSGKNLSIDYFNASNIVFIVFFKNDKFNV